MKRLAINGFGRIGRCLVRALFERQLTDEYELVAINDLADLQVLTHLTRFDSTHGHFTTDVSLNGDQLRIGPWETQLFQHQSLSSLPWAQLGIDVVIESSGKFKHRDQLAEHLVSGATRVLATHPVDNADLTVVYGVNHDQINDNHKVISNASCTTNCLAPLIKVLDDTFGVEQGQMTTIHAYTNDQNLVDKAHGDLYRARAAGVSMIPTHTGAASAVGLVLPHLAGKLDGMAVRVPTLNVSLVDLHCLLGKATNAEAVNQALERAAYGALQGVLAINDEPLVSVDFNHHPASSIVDLPHTRVQGRQAKLMSWYDNEWGFSNRLVDVLARL